MRSRGAKHAALQEAETERMIENVLARKRLMELTGEGESNPETVPEASTDTDANR